MKFICLEMLRLLVISFTTIEIEWNLEAMLLMTSCVCFEMLRTALFYCNCYVINSPVS